MRKLLLGAAALLATAVVALFFGVGGTVGLMARALPDFPELPAPPPELAGSVDVYGPCFQELGTRATNGAPCSRSGARRTRPTSRAAPCATTSAAAHASGSARWSTCPSRPPASSAW